MMLKRFRTLCPCREHLSMPSNFLISLAESICSSSFQLLVSERSCHPSPNQRVFHRHRCRLMLVKVSRLAQLRSASLITNETSGITVAPSPYRSAHCLRPDLLQAIPRFRACYVHHLLSESTSHYWRG